MDGYKYTDIYIHICLHLLLRLLLFFRIILPVTFARARYTDLQRPMPLAKADVRVRPHVRK